MARYHASGLNSASASEMALLATKRCCSGLTDRLVIWRTVSPVISRSETSTARVPGMRPNDQVERRRGGANWKRATPIGVRSNAWLARLFVERVIDCNDHSDALIWVRSPCSAPLTTLTISSRRLVSVGDGK